MLHHVRDSRISKSSIENHLHQFGFVNSFDVWVPCKLSDKNLLDHISTCDSQLTCNGNIPSVKQIVTAMKSGY